MTSGASASTIAATTAAPNTPASASPWSALNTFAAPYSPSAGAIAAALGPTYTASTASPISRAFVSSSSVAEVGLSPSASANTQIFTTSLLGSSDDLELLEERDDALVGVT